MDENKGKMKFLAVKLTALQTELKVSQEILTNVSREVDKMFHEKYFPEVPIDNTLEKETTDLEDSTPEEDPEQVHRIKKDIPDPNNMPEHEAAAKDTSLEVKKMFKQIASKIHPDKLLKLEDGYEKEHKKKLYQRAISAFESDDIVTLSNIAIELDLEIPEVTANQLKEVESKIIAIKKELSRIESTYVWQWFFTVDKVQKTAILEKLFEIMYENQRNHNLRA